MDLVFKRATPDDALRLIEVQNLSFYNDYVKYGECPSYQEKEENMIEMIRHAIVYKIVADGEIVGDIIVRNRGNGCYYLRTIAVVPEFQDLGIGSKALEFIERDNPDWREWTLITPEKSNRNRHFYEKSGYVNIGAERHSELLTLIRYQKTIMT